MGLAAGAKVSDKVRLVRRLGEGAMGEVWVGAHETLKTEVAVKFISPELMAMHPQAAVRFSVEAEAAAQIKSPHVVRTFDHGVTEDGTPYIVMELLDGESLQARLERDGVLAPERVAEVIRQVGRALDAAHRRGIIHRDIKPHNIFLIDQQGEWFIKLLDFGSAKVADTESSARLTLPGMVVGTPEYITPEQVEDPSSVSHRTDLWALGVVAYKCLTGELPFRGNTIAEVCSAIAAGRFRRPSKHRPQLPASVDRWFVQVFSHEPTLRPDSGAEMARTFEHAVEWSRQGAAPARASKWRERMSYAALALAVLIAGAAVMATQRATPSDGSTGDGPFGDGSAAASSGSASAGPLASEAPPVALVASATSPSASAGEPDAAAGGSDPAPADDGPRAPDALIRALAARRVTIPAGPFWMGCNEAVDRECRDDERPARLVELSEYAIDITEVSVALYMTCVQGGGCSRDKVDGYQLEGGPFKPSTRCNWGHASRRNHPMNCVDHAQAEAFCRWVDARLPTEAEWEKAARGLDKRRFPWGNQEASCALAVMSEGHQGCRANGTWPVGSKREGASPYQVLNMAGNVREWVADWYGAYPAAATRDPRGPERGETRVGRGGSWGSAVSRFLRTSVREGLHPSRRSIHLGFRCAGSPR